MSAEPVPKFPAQEGLERAGSSCWPGCTRVLPPSIISGGTSSQAGPALGKINNKSPSQKETGKRKKYYKIPIEKIQSIQSDQLKQSPALCSQPSKRHLPSPALPVKRGISYTVMSWQSITQIRLSGLTGSIFSRPEESKGFTDFSEPNFSTKSKKAQNSRFHGLASSLPPNMSMKVHQRVVKDIITKPHTEKYWENTAVSHTMNAACSQRSQVFTFSN